MISFHDIKHQSKRSRTRTLKFYPHSINLKHLKYEPQYRFHRPRDGSYGLSLHVMRTRRSYQYTLVNLKNSLLSQGFKNAEHTSLVTQSLSRRTSYRAQNTRRDRCVDIRC